MTNTPQARLETKHNLFRRVESLPQTPATNCCCTATKSTQIKTEGDEMKLEDWTPCRQNLTKTELNTATKHPAVHHRLGWGHEDSPYQSYGVRRSNKPRLADKTDAYGGSIFNFAKRAAINWTFRCEVGGVRPTITFSSSWADSCTHSRAGTWMSGCVCRHGNGWTRPTTILLTSMAMSRQCVVWNVAETRWRISAWSSTLRQTKLRINTPGEEDTNGCARKRK